MIKTCGVTNVGRYVKLYYVLFIKTGCLIYNIPLINATIDM